MYRIVNQVPVSRYVSNLLTAISAQLYYDRGKMTSSTTYESGYVDKLMQANTTSKFYMEYMDYRSNHLTHGLVALDRLRAPKARLDQFVEWYQKRLEKPDGKAAKDQAADLESDPERLLGSRKGYYTLVKHYTAKLKNDYASDVNLLIQRELPKLHRGMIGAAAHGLIQTGYGYAGKSDTAVCEGLAYIHHSFMPITLKDESLQLGKGDTDILDVMTNLRNDRTLQDYIRSKEVTDLSDDRISNITGPLVKNKGNALAEYVSQIKTPEFDTSNCSMEQVKEICQWFLDCVILVYTKSERKNDFFLLHGVTATWSLLQLLDALDDALQALKIIQSLVISVMAIYLAQGSPLLTLPINAVRYNEWKDIIQAVHDRKELDEHVLKLVQVVHDLSVDNSDAEKALLYKAAANSVLTNDFVF